MTSRKNKKRARLQIATKKRLANEEETRIKLLETITPAVVVQEEKKEKKIGLKSLKKDEIKVEEVKVEEVVVETEKE